VRDIIRILDLDAFRHHQAFPFHESSISLYRE
jgi:hypothetical protein